MNDTPQWIEFRPRFGWEFFTAAEFLEEKLFTLLSADEWHYLNFTSDSSIWESRIDASSLIVEYRDDSIVYLAAQTGQVHQAALLIGNRFELVPVKSPVPRGQKVL